MRRYSMLLQNTTCPSSQTYRYNDGDVLGLLVSTIWPFGRLRGVEVTLALMT